MIRAYLHDLLWEQDRDGLLGYIDQFLTVARERRIRVIFVLFDDVWNPEPTRP